MCSNIAIWELFFFKCPETLSNVVQANEEYRSYKHCNVVLNAFSKRAECQDGKRLGNAVGNQVAYCDVDDELNDRLHALGLVLEGEMLVQKVADNASNHVVWGGGYPVAQMEQIVADEHGSHSDRRVDDADQNELDHGHIEEVLEFIHYFFSFMM